MNKSIRTLAMLGLAAGLALTGTVRADEAAKMDKNDQTDAIEDLRASIGNLTSQINDLKSIVNMVQIHGFAETDVFNDTTGSFQEVVGNGAVKLNEPVGTNYLNDNGQTQASIRNSRFDFLAQKEMNGWKSKGYLEFDLLGYDPAPLYGNPAATNVTKVTAPAGGGTATVTTTKSNVASSASEAGFYTNATLRVRHAYLETQYGSLDILAGQYWSLLGWNTEYMLNTVSVAPVMGVLYQRTPQVRIGYTLGEKMHMKLQLVADAERPTERESDMLNYTQGARISFDGWNGRIASATGAAKAAPLSLAVTGTEREFTWDGSTTLGNYSYNTWGKGLAADAMVPVLPFNGKDSFSAMLTGEWSAGAGYGDEFPSWSGGAGALSATTGNPDLDSGVAMLDPKYKNAQGNSNFTLVELSSWNAQFQFHLPPSIGTFFTVGYGQISSPNVSDLVEGTSNFGSVYDLDSATFANVMQDFGSNVRVALEYDSFFTHYAGNNVTQAGEGARDNRIQLSTWYRF